MRSIIFSILTVIIYSQSLTAKTYDFSVQVTSLYTGESVKGIVILGITEKAGTEIKAITDETGKAIFKGLKAKEIHFTLTDPSGLHRKHSFTIYRKKANSVSTKIELRLCAEKEKELIQSKKKLNSLSKADSLELDKDCDSTKLIIAEYPGGYKEMITFIVKNLEYPAKAIEDEVMGKVFLRFIIEKDGSISNIEVLRGVSPELDEEAIRILAYMPRWKPTMCEDTPLRSIYQLPFNFFME